MLKRIGAEESGELKAIASGTLPSGKPVIVNADGTVGIITQTTTGASTPVEVSSADYINDAQAVYDPDTGKIVIAYHRDASNHYYGAAIVGTISGSSISFGSEVKFQANNTQGMNGLSMCYDTSQDKIFIAYGDKQNSQYAAGVVGTVSGTSISFGTTVILNSESVSRTACEFDSSNNKILLAYRRGNAYGGAEVVTLSGSSISSGSVTNFNQGNIRRPGIAFSTAANKFVLVYRDVDNSSRGRYRVATISGTSVSYGGEAALNNVSSTNFSITYDASIDKFLAVYRDSDDSNKIKARVGTLSGTTVSWGSIAVISSGNATFPCVESKGDGTAVITFSDFTTTPVANPRFVVATISGTSVSFSSPVTVASDVNSESGSINSLNFTAYDTVNDKFVYPYNDNPSGQAANSTLDAAVLQIGSTNLTSENYIGMTRGVVSESALSIGATSVVNTGTNGGQAIAYDTNSNRVVIAYKDTSNGHGKAVVGTVSGSGISFGTPVTFNAATTTGLQPSHGIAFDSSNNKVVIVYKDNGNSSYGTAIVGTVDPSDNSISYGSEAVFESAHTTFPNVTFDSSANKVLISYCDYGDSSKGKAIVGTVSGTSISFGSAAEFEAGDVNHETLMSTFDSANNKVVIAYRDGGDSNKGKAVVATVSGTSVSFGTPVEFSATNFFNSSITFDSTNNKIIIVYGDNGNSNYGTAVVGTVSGTAISFGSTVVWNNSESARNSASYSSTADKTIVFFRSGANSDTGRLLELTTSGTSVTASSTQQFSATTTSASSSVFDPDNNVVVNAYIDEGNSTDLETVQVTGTTITRAEVASGQPARLDIIGSVSDNQIGLTAGQQYFVQNNGTISTTAASPSVLAGTAISATELVVKT